jgi:hypothetical protein
MAQGDYLDMAVALAESIKKTQSTVNNISIIVDCDVDVTEHSAVDNFIELLTDISKDAEWKIHNRAFFYELSPYDETVILDADMLFLSDISHWWNLFSKHDLLITHKVKTYRDTWIDNNNAYRKTFTANNLPHTYSAFTYFKKCEKSKMFFSFVKAIMVDWDYWTLKYSPEQRQKFPSIDLAMSIAVKIMGIENEVFSNLSYPTFTHMKSECQGWKQSSDDWSSILGIYKTAQGIKLGPYLQSNILHYVKKDFV